jgi:HSP20 family protein
MAEKTTTEMAPREGQRLAPPEPDRLRNPFALFDRFAEEMDRVFDDFGLGRSWLMPRSSRSWRGAFGTNRALWAPEIEVYQRNNELVVRADLPGLKKEDVNVEVADTEVTISGERRHEQETDREGVYRSERSYGSFYRTIPLPEGAITEQAKATFRDGVLEISVPAPHQATKARRLEIRESESKK